MESRHLRAKGNGHSDGPKEASQRKPCSVQAGQAGEGSLGQSPQHTPHSFGLAEHQTGHTGMVKDRGDPSPFWCWRMNCGEPVQHPDLDHSDRLGASEGGGKLDTQPSAHGSPC